MIRLLSVSDIHLGASHLFSLEEQAAAVRQVVAIAIADKVNVVLVSGDTTHTNRPGPKVLEILGEMFRALADANIAVVIIPGNHDPDLTAVAAHFRGAVMAPTEPFLWKIEPTGLDVACLPYLPDRYVRAHHAGDASRADIARLLTSAASSIIDGFIAQKRPGVPMVLVAHGTVAGSETSTGWNMGFVPGTEYRLDGKQIGDGFDAAFVGHIHRHQAHALRSGRSAQEILVVPGSLLPLDFAEGHDPHGVVLAQLHDLKGRWSLKWQHRPIDRADVSTWHFDNSEVAALVETDAYPTSDGERIRVQIECTEETARRFPPATIEATLRKRGAAMVQIEMDVQREDRRRDSEMRRDIGPAAALERFCESDAMFAPLVDFGHQQLDALASGGLDHGSVVGHVGDLDLVRLEATNFLGLERADVRLGEGIATITGPVGAGKSATGSDIIRFALFGRGRAGTLLAPNVRRGETDMSAAVELVGPAGRFRIVRKVKVDGRGRATSMLDVLTWAEPVKPIGADKSTGFTLVEKHGPDGIWIPLSTGKVASGDAEVERILGGLTDEVLTMANLVVQRDADGWTADAKPEERRQVLARAAGLSSFDDLSRDARDRGTESERSARDSDVARNAARGRASALDSHRMAAVALEASADESAGKRTALVHDIDRLEVETTRGRDRVKEYDKAMVEVNRIGERVKELEERKRIREERKSFAQGALVRTAGQSKMLAEFIAKELDALTVVEERLAAAQRVVADRARLFERRAGLERQRAALTQERERGLARLRADLATSERAATTLADARCPIIDDITYGRTPVCNPLSMFTADAAEVAERRKAVPLWEVPGTDEARLTTEIDALEIPDAPDVAHLAREIMARKSALLAKEKARDEVKESDDNARRVIKEQDDALPDVIADLAAAKTEAGKQTQFVVGFGGSGKMLLERQERELVDARHMSETHRLAEADARERLAATRARIEDAEVAQAEADRHGADFDRLALAVSRWRALADAWKAIRVMVLENDVVPAVESVANEILRRFPYSLQIALRTQRDKAAGGVTEALDIEVLGGLGPVYESCSGGQRTTIDLALHVAIALIVSRRASTRLRYLFLDEPEGLDEAGRSALAGIVHWLADELGLRVLVASHHADLIDAIAGDQIEISGSVGASTVVRA